MSALIALGRIQVIVTRRPSSHWDDAMEERQTPYLQLFDAVPVDSEILPLPGDEWLAASVFQKAIRRADRNTAERAALSLFRIRGDRIFRRIGVIAAEDVGIGSIDGFEIAIALCRDTRLRQEAGSDEIVVRKLARLLANVPKDRSPSKTTWRDTGMRHVGPI